MTTKKRGLGRGLDVLIKSRVVEPEHDAEIVALDAEALRPNVHQPRYHFDQQALEELAASIKAQGLIQPILVRPLDESGVYEIVAGERRWRACRMAGLEKVQCIVRSMDDNESMAIALIENLQREDLNPMEEARAIGQIKEHFGITQDELADKIGKSRPAVTNCLRLLKLPEKIQQMLESGSLSAGHARALLGLEIEADMEAAAETVISKGLTVRATEELIKKMKQLVTPQGEPPVHKTQGAPDIVSLITRMKDSFRISCSGTPGKGKITLAYTSNEERERIAAMLEKLLQERNA